MKLFGDGLLYTTDVPATNQNRVIDKALSMQPMHKPKVENESPCILGSEAGTRDTWIDDIAAAESNTTESGRTRTGEP